MLVINALLMRDFKTAYGRSALSILWAIAEPIMGILLLSAVFSQISSVPPIGTSYSLFYATGYLPFLLFTSIQSRVMGSKKSSSPLFSHAKVSIIDAIASRAILQSLIMGMVTLIVYAGVWIWCRPAEVPDVSRLTEAGVIGCLLGTGIGVLNAGIESVFPHWGKVWSVATRPLFLISGVFYPFSAMPESLREVLWWNPVLHLVGINREAVYPGYDGSYVSYVYLAAVTLSCACVGLVLLISSGRD